MKKISAPMQSAKKATMNDVRLSARFSCRASGEPASNGGETASAALRRISSATNVETASTRKTASATRKPVSTVRIAEPSIEVTARPARKAKSRFERAE